MLSAEVALCSTADVCREASSQLEADGWRSLDIDLAVVGSTMLSADRGLDRGLGSQADVGQESGSQPVAYVFAESLRPVEGLAVPAGSVVLSAVEGLYGGLLS